MKKHHITLGALAIVGIASYFGYKWYQKEKKKKALASKPATPPATAPTKTSGVEGDFTNGQSGKPLDVDIQKGAIGTEVDLGSGANGGYYGAEGDYEGGYAGKVSLHYGAEGEDDYGAEGEDETYGVGGRKFLGTVRNTSPVFKSGLSEGLGLRNEKDTGSQRHFDGLYPNPSLIKYGFASGTGVALPRHYVPQFYEKGRRASSIPGATVKGWVCIDSKGNPYQSSKPCPTH